MSDFQNRFMKNVEAAYNTNLALIGRYKEDSIKTVEDLYREVAELQHTKAHMNELLDRNRLRLFFDGVENRFNSGLKKYTLEFTAEVSETYKSYDKKLKNLFSEEGVSGKDTYTYIDSNSDEEYSVFTAKANNIRIEASMLSDVQSHISTKAEKIIRLSKFKKILFGIIIPVILVILIAVGLKLATDKNKNASEVNATNATSSISSEIAQSITETAMNYLMGAAKSEAKVSMMPFVISAIIIFIMVWFLYYTILAFCIKRKTFRDLEKAIVPIYNEFLTRKPEFQDVYAAWLTSHLNEMNVKYFTKYKSLIDIVINQESRRTNGDE